MKISECLDETCLYIDCFEYTFDIDEVDKDGKVKTETNYELIAETND